MASKKQAPASKAPKTEARPDRNGTEAGLVSEEEKKMTLEEKLMALDAEIRTLHQFCVNQGYNPWQVEKSARPLFGEIKKAQYKKWGSRLWKVAIIVALASALVYYDPVYRMICAGTRIASIKLLPYWDWSRLYDEDCLIENPYYTGNQLTEEDCEVCEHLEKISRVNNISQVVLAEDYMKRDIPVIITDGIDGWEAQEQFSVHFLNELYHEDEYLKQVMPCMFASNIRVKYGSAKILLKKAAQGEITNWYAHWENCDKQAAKVIRQFYKRPYFVPPMVEMGESNWIFISSHYTGKKTKEADIALPVMWLAQIKGSTKVEVTPRGPCSRTCPVMYTTIHQGEILMVTDLMWIMQYTPFGDGESIAIGVGGYFD